MNNDRIVGIDLELYIRNAIKRWKTHKIPNHLGDYITPSVMCSDDGSIILERSKRSYY